MSVCPVNLSELRPLDRVLAFIDYNIPPEKKRAGSKLPTTREVSEILDVSSATVRNAYQILAERGLARSDMGSGTFWTKAAEDQTHGSEIVIGVNGRTLHPDQNATRWGDRIIGGLVRGMFNKGLSLRLKTVELVQDGKVLTNEEELRQRLEGINAFVIMPFPEQNILAETLRCRGISAVHVNPPALNSTSNFVSPDYFSASRLAGVAFAATGRRRVLLYLSPGTERSKSCQLRLAGFVSGLHSGEHAPDFRKLTVEADDPAEARRVFSDFLKQGWVPDAIYTAGDDLALAVMDVATEREIRIPEDMSIIGGNGLAVGGNGKNSSLTSMVQPLEEIGQQLAQMLLDKRRRPDAAAPGVVLPMNFWIGKTTLPSEDRILSNNDKM